MMVAAVIGLATVLIVLAIGMFFYRKCCGASTPLTGHTPVNSPSKNLTPIEAKREALKEEIDALSQKDFRVRCKDLGINSVGVKREVATNKLIDVEIKTWESEFKKMDSEKWYAQVEEKMDPKVEEQHMKEQVTKMIEQKRADLKKEVDALSQENFVDRCKKAKIKTAGENRTESSKKLVEHEMSV
jgi:preprotein translocase subunit SecF